MGPSYFLKKGIYELQTTEYPLIDSRRFLVPGGILGFIFPENFTNKNLFLNNFLSEDVFKNITVGFLNETNILNYDFLNKKEISIINKEHKNTNNTKTRYNLKGIFFFKKKNYTYFNYRITLINTIL